MSRTSSRLYEIRYATRLGICWNSVTVVKLIPCGVSEAGHATYHANVARFPARWFLHLTRPPQWIDEHLNAVHARCLLREVLIKSVRRARGTVVVSPLISRRSESTWPRYSGGVAAALVEQIPTNPSSRRAGRSKRRLSTPRERLTW